MLRIKHFQPVGVERGCYTRVEVNLHLAVLAFLGGDDNDTVGGTRTVDACRCSILQHLYRLDVVAVKLMHTRLCRHSVNNIKRVVVVESTNTTYAHSGSARGRTVSRDVHARDTTLKCLDGVVLVLLLQLVNAHHRDSSREVRLALGGVARHHHLLQTHRVFFDDDLHVFGCRKLLREIADVADDEGRPAVDCDFEVAVEVCHRAVRGAFLHDCRSDDGLAGLIDHRPRSFNLLRMRYGRGHTHQRHDCKSF